MKGATNKKYQRSIILILAIMQYVTIYLINQLYLPFIADYLSILQNPILEKLQKAYNRNEALDIYTMLSSCYNIPNSFWPIIAGIINDIYGYRITMLIFMFNSLIGQLLLINCFNNLHNPSYLIAGYVGRFLLGMSDSIEIPTFTLITQWFSPDETMKTVSHLFMLQTVVQMLANYYVPKIAFMYGLNFAFSFAFLLISISCLAGVTLIFLEKYIFKKQIEIQKDHHVLVEEVSNLPTIFWSSLFAGNLPFSIYFCYLVFQIQLIEIQLLKYNPNLTHQQLVDHESMLSSIPYLIQIPLYPLLGYILDKYGKRIKLMFLCVYTFFFSLVIFNKVHPFYSVILNGIFVALIITVTRSMFQQVVKKNQIGLGLGIINSFISIMVIVFNYTANIIFKDDNNQYCNQNCIIYYFIFLSFINILFCHFNSYIDSKREISLDSNDVNKLQQLIYKEVDENIKSQNNKYQFIVDLDDNNSTINNNQIQNNQNDLN